MEWPPEPRAEFEEVLVVDREQRALERREHRQLVVRPLDGRERRADRLDLLAPVKRLAADEQMRNAARLDGVRRTRGSGLRRSSRTAGTGRRCGVARAARAFPIRARSATVHPRSASVIVAIKAATASGSDSSIAFADALSTPKLRRPYGFGTASATTDGWDESSSRSFASGTYFACNVAAFSTM